MPPKKRTGSNSLLRQYEQLEQDTKTTINQQFLAARKSNKNHSNFQKALSKYVDRSQEKLRTKQALSAIFPPGKFVASKN
jgi:hypothetical protein